MLFHLAPLTLNSGHVYIQHVPVRWTNSTIHTLEIATSHTSIAKMTAKMPRIGQKRKDSTANGMFKTEGELGIDCCLPSSSTHCNIEPYFIS